MESSTPLSLTAADVMTGNPRTCSPYSSVLEAVLIFRDAQCGAVPVVNAGEPVGILTDRDVALALPEYPDLVHRSVSDIMTKGVITVGPDTPVDEVRAKFAEHRVGRLLVLDSEGVLIGIVSCSDCVVRDGNGAGEQGVADLAYQA
jgi:CBS domain-containing protein